jgi:isoleucyl-tRNA synthetase
MVRLLAPIMSFTCEEVWGYLPPLANRPPSVHMALFPKPEDMLGSANVPDDPKQIEDWTTLRSVREQVLKELEGARNSKQIGKAVEAQVKVLAAEPVYSVLARYRDQLRYVFIVSAVTLEEKKSGNGTGPVTVSVSKADGQKCERCWNYSVHVGDNKNYPTVCERCSAVLKEIEGN